MSTYLGFDSSTQSLTATVIEIAGNQRRVVFEHVLLTGDGEATVQVGAPTVTGASVKAEVLRHGREKKIIVFKRKRRKGYRKKQGHRQDFTEIRVDEVALA